MPRYQIDAKAPRSPLKVLPIRSSSTCAAMLGPTVCHQKHPQSAAQTYMWSRPLPAIPSNWHRTTLSLVPSALGPVAWGDQAHKMGLCRRATANTRPTAGRHGPMNDLPRPALVQTTATGVEQQPGVPCLDKGVSAYHKDLLVHLQPQKICFGFGRTLPPPPTVGRSPSRGGRGGVARHGYGGRRRPPTRGPCRADPCRIHRRGCVCLYFPLTTLLTTGLGGGAPLTPGATFQAPILGLPLLGTLLAPLSLPTGKVDHLVLGYRPGPSSPSPSDSKDPKSCPLQQEPLTPIALRLHCHSSRAARPRYQTRVNATHKLGGSVMISGYDHSVMISVPPARASSGVGARSIWPPAPPLASRPDSSPRFKGNTQSPQLEHLGLPPTCRGPLHVIVLSVDRTRVNTALDLGADHLVTVSFPPTLTCWGRMD